MSISLKHVSNHSPASISNNMQPVLGCLDCLSRLSSEENAATSKFLRLEQMKEDGIVRPHTLLPFLVWSHECYVRPLLVRAGAADAGIAGIFHGVSMLLHGCGNRRSAAQDQSRFIDGNYDFSGIRDHHFGDLGIVTGF